VLTEPGNSLWQTYLGGPGNESNAQILVEPDGSLYIGGEFAETADFDVRSERGLLASRGLNDIFVARFAANRDFQSVFALGAEQNDRLAGIVRDGFGLLYVMGTFGGTVDFDPGSGVTNLSSSGAADIFIAQYTRQGQLRRAQNMLNAQDDRGRALAISNNGNVVIAGEYSGSMDLGDGLSISTGQPAGVYNAFVAHFGRDTWMALPQRAYLPGILASSAAQ
jgi:hypothetical protein